MRPISEFSDRTRGCRVRYVLYPGRLRVETGGLLEKREEYEEFLRGVQPKCSRSIVYSREYLIYLACAVLTLFGAIFLGFKFHQYIAEEDGYVLAFAVPAIFLLLFLVFSYHFLVSFARRRLDMAVFFFDPGHVAFVVRRIQRDPAEFDDFLETLSYEIACSDYSLEDRADDMDWNPGEEE